MSEDEYEDSELEGYLGDIPVEDYPPDLLEVRRNKFKDQIRATRRNKRPGCPLFGVMALSMIGLVVWTSVLIVNALW